MNNKYKILLVEDEQNISTLVMTMLETAGYQVIPAGTCAMAKTLFISYCPDLVILDLGLPDMDGMTFLKEVRKNSLTPIIVLSARTNERDKVLALDSGANDYVTKPFGAAELLARIRVALRKSNQIPEEKKEKIFQCDYLKVDWEKHQVSIDGKEVHLTPMEYKILKLLIDNRGKVLTHNYILGQIWGSAQGVEAANLRVFMAALRRKIEKDPGNCRFILTEVGVGYRFRETAE